MKFDMPATINPIDQLKVIGKPHTRIDGPLKTTGAAPYAYEQNAAAPGALYGYVIGAGIAKGRIISIDVGDARRSTGVVTIITAENADKLGHGAHNTAKLLGGPEIEHYHQAVALVVAETFEQARFAASLVDIRYAKSRATFDLASARNSAVKPNKGQPDSSAGNFSQAFADAPVRHEAIYTTPDYAHAMMEPHASIAAWEGDQLTVWTSNQMIGWGRTDLATTLDIPEEKIRLVSPYIGGGFGGKLFLRTEAVLAALGAKIAGHPVKVALTRPLIFNNTTHRPATIQRIRIGTAADGKIVAIGHESWSGNLPEGATEDAVQQTRLLYAGANRMTATRLALLDLPEGNAMRAPSEASGLMALEIAIDEIAEKLGMDPVTFRILNDTQVDPENPQRPFSQRRLIECLETGAARFGWNKRTRPGSAGDGEWLHGLGVAAAFRNNLTTKSGARVRLDANGHVTVETDMTDIGTGSYTIIAQTAAEMLGLALEKINVRLGDSDFPVSSGSGGQWGANCSTSGVYAACDKLRDTVARQFGFDPEHTQFSDGMVTYNGQTVPLARAAAHGPVTVEDSVEFGDLAKKYQQSTFGAHFTEVKVSRYTGEIRMIRMLAVCASGRILNPITARSQVIGAMTMGIGSALMEHLVVDKRAGFFVNHDLAGYEVPVHADIPLQEVIFIDETDPVSSPMKAKGVGELGMCGVSAAIANAVYNATGVRIRDYPVTLDKLLHLLPAQAGTATI